MFSSLMTTRRFAPLFWCQFFSAFNDNFLKNTLVFLILFTPAITNSESLITLTAAIFIGPFFFLSGLGGQMADRFDKSIVAQRIKLVEIAVAGIAVIGFWLQSIPDPVRRAVPVRRHRHAVRPDQIRHPARPPGLRRAAGRQRAGRGRDLHGDPARHDRGRPRRQGGPPSAIFGGLIMVFALLCWGASLLIPRTGEGAPNLRIDPNIARSTVGLLKELWHDPRLWWGAVVTSWFWLVGAVALSLMPLLVKMVLGGNEDVVTVFLAIFSIAIAIGSGLAAWLAHGRIVLFPTLVGALLLGLFALDLGWATYGLPQAARGRHRRRSSPRRAGFASPIDLAGLAIGGGLFIVPIFSAVQTWAGADRRARVIAAVNVLNAAFIVVGTLLVAQLQAFGVSIPVLFLVHRRRQSRRHDGDRPHDADQPAARFPHRPVPLALPARGQRARERRQGRTERDHRAQPCELPRRRARAVVPRDRAGVRDRQRHRAALVGEAVPQVHPRACRSIRPSRWRRAR